VTPSWLAALAPRVVHHADDAAWLAARAETIGASEVPTILGRSYGSAKDVYARKKGLAEDRDTPSMRRGRLAEQYILSLAGAVPWRHADTVHHPLYPWLACTPDGYTAAGLVETKKCHDEREWSPATLHGAADWSGEICPLAYFDQGQIQLACTGAPLVDLVGAVGKWDNLVRVRILPDPDYQAELVGVIARWRARYLLGGHVPPDVDPLIETFAPVPRSQKPRKATEEEEAAIVTILDNRTKRKFMDAADTRAEAFLLRSSDAKILGTAGKATIYQRKGVETVALSAVRDNRPDLYTALVSAGLVNVSDPSTVVGVYPTKPKE
jgi:hypothetical protein